MTDLLQWREGRFEPRQLPANDHGTALWAVWDAHTDDWVRGSGAVPAWCFCDSAVDWINRQRDITGRDSTTGRTA